MSRFIKLDAAGNHLDASATDHVAVLDTTTNLTWTARNVSDEEHDFADAEKLVTGCAVMDKTDWRLPTVQELFGLVDHSRYSPAIDIDAFPGTESDWYWTSTPYAPSSSAYAWVVDFSDGSVDGHGRDDDAFVRAVSGPAPAGQ